MNGIGGTRGADRVCALSTSISTVRLRIGEAVARAVGNPPTDLRARAGRGTQESGVPAGT